MVSGDPIHSWHEMETLYEKKGIAGRLPNGPFRFFFRGVIPFEARNLVDFFNESFMILTEGRNRRTLNNPGFE